MKRKEYLFTIGFTGNTAIVDGKSMLRYGSFTTEELIEAGLFKAALGSAYYSRDPGELARVLAAYNEAAGTDFKRHEQLYRVFGLEPDPESIEKSRILK